jgi:hypothetical protein
VRPALKVDLVIPEIPEQLDLKVDLAILEIPVQLDLRVPPVLMEILVTPVPQGHKVDLVIPDQLDRRVD